VRKGGLLGCEEMGIPVRKSINRCPVTIRDVSSEFSLKARTYIVRGTLSIKIYLFVRPIQRIPPMQSSVRVQIKLLAWSAFLITIRDMAMNQFFQCFCINRFGLGPLHYLSSRSDFSFKFSEIFIFENLLPASVSLEVDKIAWSIPFFKTFQ
jgi:hypothetical protein